MNLVVDDRAGLMQMLTIGQNGLYWTNGFLRSMLTAQYG
jgi:hypothetical protein